MGASLVNYTPQNILKLILGVFLLVYSVTLFFKPELKFKPSKKNAIVGGGLSGFLAGLIGTGGTLRGAFLTSFNLKKNVYIATAAAIALAVDLIRIPVYLKDKFLSSQFYYFIPILLVVALLSSYTGKKIVNKIHQNSFKKIVLIFITLASLKFIYDGMQFLF